MHAWKQKCVGVCFQKSISGGSCRNRHYTPSLGARETLRMNQVRGSDVETEESRGTPWCLWDVTQSPGLRNESRIIVAQEGARHGLPQHVKKIECSQGSGSGSRSFSATTCTRDPVLLGRLGGHSRQIPLVVRATGFQSWPQHLACM